MLLHTKDEVEYMKRSSFNMLVEDVGGRGHLAKMLGVSTSLVIMWTKTGQISKRGAQLVHDHPRLGKKYCRKMLRPDLFYKDEDRATSGLGDIDDIT